MRETGVIIRTNQRKATIRMFRGAKCEGCNLCSSFGEGSLEVEADNPIEARQGEWVDVEISPSHVVGHGLLLFIFPIVAIIFGYFVGAGLHSDFAGTAENRGILMSLVFLVLSFGFIKIYDNIFRNSDHQTATIVSRGVSPDLNVRENQNLVW